MATDTAAPLGGSSISGVTEVQVRFVSKTCPPVPEGSFAVPLTLARYGLSEIVNHLLENDPPRPYDFLIEGEFLRTDLGRYLESKNLSGEAGLTLEYVEAMPAPQEQPGRPHPDWVSAIDASHERLIVTGCYDGRVRLWELSSSSSSSATPRPLAIGIGHTSAVKAVKLLPTVPAEARKDGERYLVSASKDRSVRVWKFTESTMRCAPYALCSGHEEAVEALAVVDGLDRFATGGWDKRILLWNFPSVAAPSAPAGKKGKEQKRKAKKDEEESDEDEDDSDSEEEEEGGSKKKRRRAETGKAPGAAASKGGSSSSLPEEGPISVLEGHSQAVSALSWPNPLALYSGSWDHSIRQWDPKTGQNVSTWNGSKVVSALDFSLLANLIATGHNDNVVRLWDPRQHQSEVAKQSLRSHKGWVTSVVWSPTNMNLLTSASHDGTVKVWDIRSKVPLHTLVAHKDAKALCVDWHGSSLLSGGSDCKLQSFAWGAGASSSSSFSEGGEQKQSAAAASAGEKGKAEEKEAAPTKAKAKAKAKSKGKAAKAVSMDTADDE